MSKPQIKLWIHGLNIVRVCGVGVVPVLFKNENMCSFQTVAWKTRHNAASSVGSERIGRLSVSFYLFRQHDTDKESVADLHKLNREAGY